jgi:hypothetical protein
VLLDSCLIAGGEVPLFKWRQRGGTDLVYHGADLTALGILKKPF